MKNSFNSVVAGVFIGLAGMVNLSVDNRYIGAILFSIGLLAVCMISGNLYTGAICYYKRDNTFTILVNLIGNITGTGLVALLIRFTRFWLPLHEKATSICEAKLSDSPVSLILLGVICNIFIFIAVECYKSHNTIIPILLAVPGFILCGSEHCIADSFYYFMNGWDLSCFNIIYVVIGNTLGGLLMGHLFIHNQK